MLGATYNFDISTSFTGDAVLINNNEFYSPSNALSTGTITISPNDKLMLKVTTTNITNIYGRKNSECLLYTDESGLKIVGSGSSSTHLGSEITLEPYRLYKIKFLDLNKFIVSA